MGLRGIRWPQALCEGCPLRAAFQAAQSMTVHGLDYGLHATAEDGHAVNKRGAGKRSAQPPPCLPAGSRTAKPSAARKMKGVAISNNNQWLPALRQSLEANCITL